MGMSKDEALVFLAAHSRWLAENEAILPNGATYKAQFDAAVYALDEAHVTDQQWEAECLALLKKPQHLHAPSNYVAAIKLTRAVFQCSLVDGRNRVDALRGRYGL